MMFSIAGQCPVQIRKKPENQRTNRFFYLPSCKSNKPEYYKSFVYFHILP